ncbi:cell-division control histidine kinase PdhS [bacterium BMS3Bbin10]|nr:cell-division control histidine kinase PdhS [bacterium BMS3Bbin10]HDL16979.1 sensor histidine kinase [Hyphomicrobiales bacterium]
MSRASLNRSGNLSRGYAGAIAPHAGAAGSLLSRYSLRLGNTLVRHRAELAERASRVEAEFASRVKTEFIANISHELRTPLNSILGFSKMLKGTGASPLEPRQIAEYAGFILGSAEGLLSVVNDVITISKLQSGKFELAMDLVDLDELLHCCAAWAGDRVENSRCRLITRIDESLPAILADAEHLKDVVIRLLSNAMRFTPAQGAVALTAKCGPRGKVIICISDTGTGMSAQEISVALTEFGQVDNRLDRRHEGTGLGLPIAKTLTERQGGEFLIRSEEGRGTDVILLFAAAAQAGEPRTASEHAGIR